MSKSKNKPNAEKTLTKYKGFKIPQGTSKLAKRALRQLKKKKVIAFEHDDGLSAVVRNELVSIAEAIGLPFYKKEHVVVIFRPKFHKKRTIAADKE